MLFIERRMRKDFGLWDTVLYKIESVSVNESMIKLSGSENFVQLKKGILNSCGLSLKDIKIAVMNPLNAVQIELEIFEGDVLSDREYVSVRRLGL